MKKRKTSASTLKTKVAANAIREEMTLAKLSNKYFEDEDLETGHD
jgi:hypothetical protein